ncbi:MAG TPA: hypothetical protein VFM05_12190 [Candidatus Saccharimonadales bacterium]|nr:hypothetical protein [Candidatus Saccharimonadales bacterium]
MPNDITLIAALIVPMALLTVLRVNAAMVFLSLCLGYVLVQFVANDADSLIGFVAPDAESLSASSLKLIMLFTPVVLTMIIMAFSIHGRLRVGLNALPAAATSLLTFLLAVPLFTPGLQYAIQSQNVWYEVHQAQALIVGAGALVSMVFLWSQRRRAKHAEEHRRHH